jgi:hypothetical protein
MGVDIEPVSGGCCGLAGSWGFEEGHHEISLECGEQALLPAVRKADADTVIIANGFSCKTQIEQGGTERRALHVAQAMKMAREHGPQGYLAGRPEAPYYEARPQAPARRQALRVGAIGGVAIVAALGIARLATA